MEGGEEKLVVGFGAREKGAGCDYDSRYACL
jgi:hypothetical protein